MPRKAARPDTQVERLADEFRRRWVAADGIEPWLRRNIGRLARLTENGWSWADIGRALTAAGITYSTGRPWTGPLLARKAVQVRAQIRKRQARRRTVDPVMPRQPRPEPVRPLAPVKVLTPEPDSIETDEPELTFAFASYAKRPTTPNEKD